MKTSSPFDFFSAQVVRGDYYVSSREDGEGGESEVVCAGWENCTADYAIERDSFAYYALEFVAGGEWELSRPEGVKRLSIGSVFLYGPDIPYRMRAVGDGGWSKYFVDFRSPLDFVSNGDGRLEVGGSALLSSHGWLRELFDQLIQVKDLPFSVQSEIADQTLRLMLARLPLHVSIGPQASLGWQSFERCRNYLRENYLTVASLSEAARACGVAPAYLSRLFRKHSNETPKAFLDRLRMSFAAQKLLRDNLQVKQVAEEAGYADVFHFSRVFKKTFGVAPSGFAKRLE